jgi:hypothetical protein
MQIELDEDGSYTLNFFWNTREEAWFMDILDTLEQTTFLSGLRLSAAYGILKQYHGLLGVPKGDFFIVDSEGNNTGIDFDNIGVGLRFQMYYLSKREIDGL